MSYYGTRLVQPAIFNPDLARQAWPQLADHRAELVARVDTLGESDAIRAADLYLAIACTSGDPAALRELEQLFAPLRAMLVRTYRDATLVDDALQVVRYRLLVATPERGAKLDTYRGRGSLAGWLRVVALRQVRELAVARDRDPATPDDTLADAATGADPMLELLVRTHGTAVRRVVREAVAALDARQRELLRLEVLEGVAHQQIAERHGVHRTTAMRWLDEVRQTVAREVRRRISSELGLGAESADSLLRALDHRVELSLASGLLA